jgi:hypothetical protein
MPTSAIPVTVLANHSLELSGTMTDLRIDTVIELWMIVDENLSCVESLLNRTGPGSFEYRLGLSGYSLKTGKHSFSFYAVDATLGRISSALRYSTTIVPLLDAGAVIPLWFCRGTQVNFEIYGNTSDGLKVWTSSEGSGYATRMQIHGIDSQESCPYEGRLDHYGVSLTTHLTRLGEHAISIGFKLVNHNSESTTVNVECDSDIAPDIEGEPSVCRSIGGSRGFYFREGTMCGFTMIGRGYPLVRNVTNYWFGSYDSWMYSLLVTGQGWIRVER